MRGRGDRKFGLLGYKGHRKRPAMLHRTLLDVFPAAREPTFSRGSILLAIWLMAVFTSSCALKSLVHQGTDIRYEEDRLVCTAMTQGAPVMLSLGISRALNEDAVLFRKAHWGYEAWLFYKNVERCFYSKRVRAEKDSKKIPNPDKKTIAAWTDKDELVFGMGEEGREVLVVTEPIYADRSRRIGSALVDYTLVPVKLYFGKRLVEGSAFFQHVSHKGRVRRYIGPERVAFVKSGTACFLWDPSGGFWYIEQLVGEDDAGARSAFATTQDRRGQWDETTEAEIVPVSRGDGSGGGERSAWHVSVPGWGLEADVASARLDRTAPGSSSGADGSGGGGYDGSGSLESLCEGLRAYPSPSRSRFRQVEGTLRIGRETRTVRGLVQSCCDSVQ